MHRNVERGAQYNASAQGAEVEECLRNMIQLTQPWDGTIWTFMGGWDIYVQVIVWIVKLITVYTD